MGPLFFAEPMLRERWHRERRGGLHGIVSKKDIGERRRVQTETGSGTGNVSIRAARIRDETRSILAGQQFQSTGEGPFQASKCRPFHESGKGLLLARDLWDHPVDLSPQL